jgi:HD-like signal output (HDOD) protein
MLAAKELKPPVTRLSPAEIEARIALCPSLPSLGRISQSLHSFLQADQRYTGQISETVRRDPSLTSHLLRLANSVYYGLATPVQSIEEAVFYLGMRQIRQLALVTPIIEDFQRLTVRSAFFPWREFWQHCIGVAIMTREVASAVQTPLEEGDYVAGLVHDLGKAVMAWSFPQYFAEIHRATSERPGDLIRLEQEILGMDHGEVGALYMQHRLLPEVMVEATRFHHHPGRARRFPVIIAAVNVADLLVRMQEIGFSGERRKVTWDECVASEGWALLFPGGHEDMASRARASLTRSVQQLPRLIENLF